MLSNKPYLIRAFYDWIVDSRCTPLLVVDATQPRCNVPQEYVENGEIILNVSPDAIRDFKVSATLVEFKASFSGIAHLISVPMRAVLAVYAEENGQGMFFDADHDDQAENNEWETQDFIENENLQTDHQVARSTLDHANKNTAPNDANSTTADKRKSHLKLVE